MADSGVKQWPADSGVKQWNEREPGKPLVGEPKPCGLCKQDCADAFGPAFRLHEVEIKVLSRKLAQNAVPEVRNIWSDPNNLWVVLEVCDVCWPVVRRIVESVESLLDQQRPRHVLVPQALVLARPRRWWQWWRA